MFVVAPTTRTFNALDVLALNDDVPPKLAVSAWLPSGKALVWKVATPELLTVAVPSTVVPSRNVTVPAFTVVPDAHTLAV